LPTHIHSIKKKIINYTNPSLETVTDKYRSDVSVKYNDSILHFEIVVRNKLTLEKINYYKKNKINCIKIDLSSRILLSAEPKDIRDAVIEDKKKDFIQWNEDENCNWLIACGLFIASLFFLNRLLRGRHKIKK
jgi:hypothetical protein